MHKEKEAQRKRAESLFGLMERTDVELCADDVAGVCGNRTHPGGRSPPTLVLKTRGHTSTQLLPCKRESDARRRALPSRWVRPWRSQNSSTSRA